MPARADGPPTHDPGGADVAADGFALVTGVVHVVLFRFADTADEAARAEVSRRFRALADGERDGRRYIRSIRSGPNTSPEGHGHGFDVGFVVEFDSADDRGYYLGPPFTEGAGDPDHAAFTRFVGPLIAEVLVFDVGD